MFCRREVPALRGLLMVKYRMFATRQSVFNDPRTAHTMNTHTVHPQDHPSPPGRGKFSRPAPAAASGRSPASPSSPAPPHKPPASPPVQDPPPPLPTQHHPVAPQPQPEQLEMHQLPEAPHQISRLHPLRPRPTRRVQLSFSRVPPPRPHLPVDDEQVVSVRHAAAG